MKKTSFKPKTQVSIHILAEQEVEAIQVDGKIYVEYPMPFSIMEGVNKASSTEEVEDEPVSTGPERKSYSEDELMEMDPKEIMKLCKSLGIDPDATEGKNTNKKLRLLILDAQKGSTSPSKKTDKKEENDEITSIVEGLDAQELKEKEAIMQLTSLGLPKKGVTEIINEMMDDDSITVASVVKKLKALSSEEDADEEDEEDTPPAKAKTTKKATKEVAIDDLEVGDKVSVYWVSHDDWYKGEVASIKKGVVMIDYEDETSESLDPEENTKIKLLS